MISWMSFMAKRGVNEWRWPIPARLSLFFKPVDLWSDDLPIRQIEAETKDPSQYPDHSFQRRLIRRRELTCSLPMKTSNRSLKPRWATLPALIVLLFPSLLFSQDAELSPFAIPETDEGLPGVGPIRRYDWFKGVWERRRAAWAKTVEQDQGAVVFLGDSITQGWGGGLGASFPGLKVVNRGIDGDTTRGVLIRLQEDVLALNPKAVALLIGTNDLEENATPEQAASNLKRILAALKAHNAEMPIILCEVFPSAASMSRPSEQIGKVNELYLELVKGDSQVTYMETFDLFDDGNGDAIPAEFPDLLHPNEAGYAKWAAALRPVFETLGLSAFEDDFELEEGFEYLFNGYDLTGWGYRITPEEDRESARRWQSGDPKGAAAWPFVEEAVTFDGLKVSPDGRFAAINGRLVATTPHEYRKIQKLHTTREFSEDFILKLEFRATPLADSGIYIRGPQLQCRDYALAGPYTDLERYKPQDWNEIVITVRGNVARCVCNGEVLETEFELPDVGPIGIEGDRGQVEYRRIRIKPL